MARDANHVMSMTGFGTAEGPVGGGRMLLDVRTVNHRHFSFQGRLPQAVQQFELEVRDRLKSRISRGHVSVSARWVEEPLGAKGLTVNLERAREVIAVLRELKETLELSGEPDLAFVARQPEVIVVGGETEDRDLSGELLGLLEAAVEGVCQMRRAEGAALAAELGRCLGAMETAVATVERQAPERLVRERERLRNAVAELLDGRTIDDDRLALELALLADKLDIAEEVVRLRTHIAACRATLGEEGPIGRRLVFLGQEMLREANTIGSKANDAGITATVIEMKGELEKFREQVENVE